MARQGLACFSPPSVTGAAITVLTLDQHAEGIHAGDMDSGVTEFDFCLLGELAVRHNGVPVTVPTGKHLRKALAEYARH